MKKYLILILIILSIILFDFGCTNNQNENLGNFSLDKTYSFDSKYYALQNPNGEMVEIAVYNTNNDEMIYKFEPARKSDFWGICWERENYNIWIQSGDVGVLCYKYDGGQWALSEDAVRPDYIVSRYDEIESN